MVIGVGMKRVNIILVDNKFGLSRDASILREVLQKANFKVTVFEVGKPTLDHKIQRLSTYVNRFASELINKNPPYDINLFLEYVIPAWFPYAHLNCLIPNQEWLRDDWRPFLNQFDYILCKTKFAQAIFDKLGCKTEFIGFTSLDRFNPQSSKNYDKFFHLAGKSAQKGTDIIINLWRRHPEWPPLTIRRNWQEPDSMSTTNIEYITHYLDDKILRDYQNSHGIHLCPSEAEGFGHLIAEAMSCRSVTITTNAPPMNELIAPDRGILVDYCLTSVQCLGINYHVDTQALEQKVNEVLGMDYLTKKSLGDKARDWYHQNDNLFRRRLVDILNTI